MTSYYYSAKKNVFIAAGSALLETDAFPDAVVVSDEIFAEFFVGEKGMLDDNYNPCSRVNYPKEVIPENMSLLSAS